MKTTFLLLAIVPAALAQQTVAPTSDEKIGPVRGENAGDYNVVQSWELGYRFASIGGNEGAYRADVNFRNGLRLLGSSLTVNSMDGHGRLFDEVVLTTQGLGNDPYEAANFRIQKNRLYEYGLNWRENDYFNPALTVSAGEHLMNTTHRWQDHEIQLFPQAKFRVRAGYSRVGQTGPALTTEQFFDDRGDVIPVFRNVRREYNEYRAGADAQFSGFRFSFLHRWELFKEDTTDSLGIAVQVNQTTLTSLQRAEPNHGYTSGWMGNLFGERRVFTLNAHITYASGARNFVQSESAIGIDRLGTSQNRQILVSGDASRPMLTANLNVTLFPASRWNIVNNNSVTNLRIEGNNFFQQFDNSAFSFNELNFQFLGIRLLTNSTDVRFHAARTFDVFGGFRFSDRLIRTTIVAGTPGFPPDSARHEQTNTLKAGAAGFNWTPIAGLRIHAEGEFGRNDNPFVPVSERNYHAIRGRVQYRARTLMAGVSYTENYNNNSIVLSSYSSHARNYSGEASWSVRPSLSMDGSYSKLHLDTIGGIAFFAGSPRPTLQNGFESIFISNIHAGNVAIRFSPVKRLDLYVGYNITKDTGDGRGTLLPQLTAVQQILYNVQTFPLSFQSPFGRMSLRINTKLRWNVGYQWYGYHEQFGVLDVNENYRAHTGFTSLLWSF